MRLFPFYACWLGTVNPSILLNLAEKSRGWSYITYMTSGVCSGGEGCDVTMMPLWW
ncbi:hypothetical protein QL093DRAFT_2318430 [Fusarium oxysporum]|nr:hypothetical protein QL093DRAFT_2318430 [Fusarium oxysporum]